MGAMLPNLPEDYVHAHRFGILERFKAGGHAAHFAQQTSHTNRLSFLSEKGGMLPIFQQELLIQIVSSSSFQNMGK